MLHAKTYTNNSYIEGCGFNPDGADNSFYLVSDSNAVTGIGVHGDISVLVPGDVIRYGGGWHWAIIQEIKYPDDDHVRVPQLVDITLIHTATYDAYWLVQKGETLQTFGNNVHKCLLRPIFQNN